MSEAEKVPSGAPDPTASGEGSEPVVKVGDQGDEQTVSYVTHKKLLGEKKRQDERMTELETQLSELTNKRLESEGNKDELITKLRTELTSTKDTRQKETAKYAYKVITDQVKLEAVRLGCLDSDALVKLAELDELEVDENFNVDNESTKRIVEDIRKKRPYLFNKPSPKVIDGVPALIKTL